MSVLDIPPHSPATSRLAVTALALVAGFALTSGFLRQAVAVAPQHQAAATRTDLIAEATPAPEPTLQVAEPAPRRVHVAEAAPVDVIEDIAPADADAVPAVPAADASAIAPDPAAPAPTAANDPTMD